VQIIHKAVQNPARSLVALLALVVAMAPNAAARHGRYQADDEPSPVITHLALPGASVSGMFLQEEAGRQYLYIEQDSGAGLTIVDVTKPDHPNVIKRLAWPADASRGRLQMVGAGLALVRASGEESGRTGSGHSTESVSVLDLSDPTNPRAVQSFMRVTSIVSDETRSLIFISNSEGLWVLRNKQKQAAAPIELCSSESAIAGDLQNCY
jgi:hypothetical protein